MGRWAAPLASLLALALVVGACSAPRATPTPALPPQGLVVLRATPLPAPNVIIGLGDTAVVEGLLLRVLALQLPPAPPAQEAAERRAIVSLVVRQVSGPRAYLAPGEQMRLEDQQGRRYRPEPLDGGDAAPFWLEEREERGLRLVYRLPQEVQRLRWVFLLGGEPVLTVDFGPLPLESS